MYVAQLSITPSEGAEDDALAALYGWLGALRHNGQIEGPDAPIARTTHTFTCTVLLPEIDALDEAYGGRWVHQSREPLNAAIEAPPNIDILGEEAESAPPCRCPSPSAYILYTYFLSLESPLRCGNCFGTIPHYRIPKTTDNNGIFAWQRDYQALDQLQIGCGTGERFALREMGRPDSSLSQRGRAICRHIEEALCLPAYYRLHRYYGRSWRTEQQRRCPACGGEWLLSEPWHRLFNFRCDNCRLLSNLAPSLSTENRRIART